MVGGAGGGIRRDDGLPAISSTNIFSALESRRRRFSKKKSDKDKDSSSSSSHNKEGTLPSPQAWTPTPVSVTSWADCEEDDDDYFAMPALPPISDPPTEQLAASHDDLSQGEESESDEELEEVDEENEEAEAEAPELLMEVNVAPVVQTSAVVREPERQLSKKELKKKGLAELEAVLAELGLTQKDEKDSVETPSARKETSEKVEVNGQGQNLTTVVESKNKRRKAAKREKSFKEGKEEEPVQDSTDGLLKEDAEKEIELDAKPADPKEVMKKMASMKKKKSFKESDGAAKAAAAEAAARAAKLAAAKKKEKSHYNQQPVR